MNPAKFKKKNCRYCDEEFTPTAPSHLYCSDDCAKNGVIQRHYRRSYGMTYKEVLSLREKQDNLCAICGETGFMMNERVKSSLNVDHCHETGEVRGLLCHNCNRGLGLFQDSVSRLKSAIAYLEGATTIPEGSRAERPEAHSPSKEGDDIVCSA